MSEAVKADYAEYEEASQAFDSFIHKGFGSSECYTPLASQHKKDEHDEMCAEIARRLTKVPMVMSEVAIRRQMKMRKIDAFHVQDMADNTAYMVEHTTAALQLMDFY